MREEARAGSEAADTSAGAPVLRRHDEQQDSGAHGGLSVRPRDDRRSGVPLDGTGDDDAAHGGDVRRGSEGVLRRLAPRKRVPQPQRALASSRCAPEG